MTHSMYGVSINWHNFASKWYTLSNLVLIHEKSSKCWWVRQDKIQFWDKLLAPKEMKFKMTSFTKCSKGTAFDFNLQMVSLYYAKRLHRFQIWLLLQWFSNCFLSHFQISTSQQRLLDGFVWSFPLRALSLLQRNVVVFLELQKEVKMTNLCTRCWQLLPLSTLKTLDSIDDKVRHMPLWLDWNLFDDAHNVLIQLLSAR